MSKAAVLGESFRPKNVTGVPSLFGTERCQMGQVRVDMDRTYRLPHLKKGRPSSRQELKGQGTGIEER